MSNQNPKDNSAHLIKHAKRKSDESREKVEKAIKKLIKEKGIINFNNVSQIAGVSKPFLYNNKDIRERIETLRGQQSSLNSPKAIKTNMQDKNKDALIEILRNKVKQLESENQQYKVELQRYQSKIYDSI